MWTQLLVLSAVSGLGMAQLATVSYGVLPATGSVLNLDVVTYNTTYNVTDTDTIFSIAEDFGVGVCDLARLNIMADPELLAAGDILNIPATPLLPNDYSCFSVNNTNTTNTCIAAGPHVYTVVTGDTLQKIANVRYNITVDSIFDQDALPAWVAGTDPYAELVAGNALKIPLCSNTACTFTPFNVTYGVLQDFATLYNITVGQIMSLNPGYTYSQAGSPQLGVLYSCGYLS